jgi:hypothetical protein
VDVEVDVVVVVLQVVLPSGVVVTVVLVEDVLVVLLIGSSASCLNRKDSNVSFRIGNRIGFEIYAVQK